MNWDSEDVARGVPLNLGYGKLIFAVAARGPCYIRLHHPAHLAVDGTPSQTVLFYSLAKEINEEIN